MANQNDYIVNVKAKGVGASNNQLKGLNNTLGKMTIAIASVSGAYYGAKGLLDAYGRQEQAEKKLRFALGSSTKALRDQASALQSVTRFGDEAIIEQQAFLASLKFTENQIKEIIPVALDLSEATGMTLESAVRNLSKTFSGLQGELGEAIPQLKNLTAEQLKSGEGVKLLGELFAGQATDGAKTLNGSLDQLSNAVGDVAEALATLLVPIVVPTAKIIKEFSKLFDENRIKSYATALIGAGTAYGIFAIATGKAAKAMLAFNKISKKNIAVLAGTLIVGELIEKFNLFSDESDSLSDEIDGLASSFDDLNKKQKITLEQQHKLANSTMQLSMAEQGLTEFETQKNLQSAKKVQLNELLKAKKISQIDFSIKMNELITKDIELEKIRQKAKLDSFSAISGGLAKLNQSSKGSAKVTARLMQTQAIVDTYAGANRAIATGVPPFSYIQAAASIAMGLANVVEIEKGIGKFQYGGMVGGKRHSQGGTIIEAEQGEFVMSRDAVSRIGINNLNAMNQGASGTTINISAPLLDDTIVDSIIPKIEEAVRRGSDLGV